MRPLETRLTPSLISLASFDGADGKMPMGSVVIDSSGDVFGTTYDGATSGPGPGLGALFEVVAGSGHVTEIAPFGTGAGNHPAGGLISDSSGNLYGTGFTGGAYHDGTVFEVAAGSHAITRLVAFDGTNGSYPDAALIMDSGGNLYGTTLSGGAFGHGTVFELPKGSGVVTTLASFDGADGAGPEGALVLDSSGDLYGTTSAGGASSLGTVFEIVKGSATVTTLASFNGTDGADPQCGLVLDRAGNLYGTTQLGGPGWSPGTQEYGTVFEVAHGSGTITTLASFNGSNGSLPTADLLMDNSGNLYGIARNGGPHGVGTIFELPTGSGTITTLATFNGGSNGGFPAGLTMDAGGNLYGVTEKGGPNKDGTVFELPAGAVALDQWTGADSAVDTNWSDGANWSLGTPPTAGQIALFSNNSSVKSFTATVDAGFTNAIGGLVIDGTWGGTITVNSPLTVTGNFTLASGTLGGNGAMTIEGRASQWTGGQIDAGTGGFTNTGSLTADTTAGNLVVSGAGTLTNDGSITEAGTNSLVLENSATLDNAAGAVFDLTGDGGVSQSGGGTFTNAGTLEKTGGTGTGTIATTTLDNPGTVAVSSGVLDISAAVSQVSGKTLTAGTWTVTGTATVHAKLDITSAGRFTTLGSAAQVTLDGTTVAFPNFTALAAIDQGAALSLLDGQSRTMVGALTNAGSLVLGPGSTLTVSGGYTQASTGSLTAEIGGSDTAPTVGAVVSTAGTVSLAGSLDVTSTVVPAVGSSLTLLVNEGNSPISGTFAGLPEGGTFNVPVGGTTMTFQISYVGPGASGDNNVVITRTA